MNVMESLFKVIVIVSPPVEFRFSLTHWRTRRIVVVSVSGYLSV
jgi:hypothetical protein